MTHQLPPRWDEQQLQESSLIAIGLFRDERLREDLEQYSTYFLEAQSSVEDMMEASVDLSNLRGQSLELLTDPGTLRAVRYLAGPPISKDDLETLAEVQLSAFALRRNSSMAMQAVDTVLLGIDRNRFGWLSEDRAPTEAERRAAVIATASLMAAQRIATARRNDGKKAQENLVRDTLIAAGFRQVPTREVRTLVDAPGRGEFCGESVLGRRKADIILRLWDDRVMPIECKVSNSATNSVKRLNNDAAAKADDWIRDFGRTQIVPSAMLAGVFKVKNLQDAQKNGLTIWWSHDLDRFTRWVEQTRVKNR